MEKFARRLTSLVAGFLALALFLGYTGHLRLVDARLTGTNPTGTSADTFCIGPKTFEVCADYLGDWLPTTNNTQSLGTSALSWSNIYSVAETVTGANTVGTAGTLNAAGTSGTAASLNTINGVQVFAEASVSGIVISTTIPVNSSYQVLLSTGGSCKMTSTPTISTTTIVAGTTLLPSGTFLILSSTTTANDVVLQSSGTLAASGLVLGAATRTITRHKVLTLILDTRQVPALWREVSYGNN